MQLLDSILILQMLCIVSFPFNLNCFLWDHCSTKFCFWFAFIIFSSRFHPHGFFFFWGGGDNVQCIYHIFLFSKMVEMRKGSSGINREILCPWVLESDVWARLSCCMKIDNKKLSIISFIKRNTHS